MSRLAPIAERQLLASYALVPAMHERPLAVYSAPQAFEKKWDRFRSNLHRKAQKSEIAVSLES